MEKTIKKWVVHHGGYFLLSIFLPIMIMASVYYLIGIYPGSELTILASDGFSQYSNFHASFNNVLHGKQNIFYSWYASLGLNYWALAAYYLNGIFTPIVYFFDNQAMPDALYFITLIKFGTIGGSFWIFSSQTFKLSKWYHVAFSVAYTLMAYTTAYSEVIMWLDAFVYLPLIVLGIHRIMDQRKPTVLFFSYLLLFLSNFYMAFMIGIFSFLYFFSRLFTNRKRYQGSIVMYLITSFLAGGASMIVILPTLLDLKNNGESLDTIHQFLQPNTGVWDIVTKSMIGIYDTSKYGSAPFLYVGLLPLIFCLFYFISKKIPLRNKLLYGSLFVLLIASVYINVLNLFWHGLHAPNMFLYRFSFLFSFLVILLAGYGLELLEKETVEKAINIILVLLGLFMAAYFFANRQRYSYLSANSFIINVVFLVIYIILLLVYRKDKCKAVLPVVFAVFMIGEAAFNSKVMIDGIKNDWGYLKRITYEQHYEEINELVEQTKEESTGFYRVGNLDEVTPNDSFNFGYGGVSMFSSIRNRNSSTYLNSLGFRSNKSNLNIRYSNNTIIMDSLIGIKYNLSKYELKKYGYEKIGKKGEYHLYENKNALPLGILTNKEIYQKNAINNQSELINHLSGMEESFVSFGEAKVKETKNLVLESSGENQVYSKQDVTEDGLITWTIDIPANTQAYLNLVASDDFNMTKTEVTLTVEGISRKSRILDSGEYYDLGYFKEAKSIQVETTFNSQHAKINLYRPDVTYLNTTRFEKAIQQVQKKGVELKTSGRKVKAEVVLNEDQVILTTIPYDKGWTAFIDGKKTKIPTFKDAFLTLPVSKGAHSIEFVFLPQGFMVGAILFVSCIVLFLIYFIWLKRRSRNFSEGVIR
ncbi:hypothetical protein DOK67_0001436 [Enterococcus sp. DIV0212c]|uniref:YfhO family protein n=1 Tax=Enterococcus sp. DIV0212c TaxID=2230867 RepID=UPI001A9A72FE|nr:YfhO family protein [Enterococcus sp. DIV0212c]MBO1354356.1 YfhO family protein [Enterococcus sp. DIV0212c]